MIVLDTHIWRWWISAKERLSIPHRDLIADHASDGLIVSVFSCWEIAKAVESGKLNFAIDVGEWLAAATTASGVRIEPLSLDIILESTRLPGDFHRDPGDQIIVATARVLDLPLLTVDGKIRQYPHVNLADAPST